MESLAADSDDEDEREAASAATAPVRSGGQVGQGQRGAAGRGKRQPLRGQTPKRKTPPDLSSYMPVGERAPGSAAASARSSRPRSATGGGSYASGQRFFQPSHGQNQQGQQQRPWSSGGAADRMTVGWDSSTYPAYRLINSN
jgi:hypothetical protein